MFGRGAPEPLVIDRQPAYADNLIDLLKAYAQRRQKSVTARLSGGAPALAVAEARRILERLIGGPPNGAGSMLSCRLSERAGEALVGARLEPDGFARNGTRGSSSCARPAPWPDLFETQVMTASSALADIIERLKRRGGGSAP